jgi:FRG domain
MVKDDDYCHIKFKNYSDFERLYNVLTKSNFDYYLYRGQANEKWPLETSLDRYLDYLKENNFFPDSLYIKYEKNNLDDFKEGSRNFRKDFQIPENYNVIDEWLVLVQHYGGKTRLLDFSYSFPIALYFALDSTYYNENAAVWILNPSKLDYSAKFDEIYREFYKKPSNSLFYSFETKDLGLGIIQNIKSKRMMYQQGNLIYGKNFKKNIMENLFIGKTRGEIENSLNNGENIIDINDEVNNDKIFEILNCVKVAKIEISTEFKYNILSLLNQSNINSWTIYPDFEGFVKKLYFPFQPFTKIHQILSKLPSCFTRDDKEKIRIIFENNVVEKQNDLFEYMKKYIQTKYKFDELEQFFTKANSFFQKNNLVGYVKNFERAERDHIRFNSIKYIFEIVMDYEGLLLKTIMDNNEMEKKNKKVVRSSSASVLKPSRP